MLSEFAWRAFENTGNVDAYVFYREIEATRQQRADQTMIAEDEVATGRQK